MLKTCRARIDGRAGVLLIATLAAGCAPPAPPPPAPPPAHPAEAAVGLPAVPRVDGPLRIQVVHPTAATPLPAVDSTFIYGPPTLPSRSWNA